MDYKEKVIALLNSKELSKEQKEKLESIFPELRESEDEKIRKALINFLKSPFVNENITDEKVAPWIAWLENTQYAIDHAKREGFQLGYKAGIENHGEQIHDNSAKTCDGKQDSTNNQFTPEQAGVLNKHIDKFLEQKPADMAEPKFEIEKGKWYVCTQTYTLKGKIVVIKGQTYKSNQNGVIEGEDEWLFLDKIDGKALNYFKPWTIQDAKDGDVLATEDWRFIFKKINSNGKPVCHCHYDIDLGFRIDTNSYIATGSEIYPATKEQRDLLFQKMNEAGYEWDAEKKELKKIEQKPTDKVDQHSLPVSDNSSLPTFDESIYHPCTEEAYKQKSDVWSEEDEKQARQIERIVHDDGCTQKLQKQIADWLKTIKDRVQPQPKWSEEDELHIKELESLVKRVWAIAEHENDKETIHKMSDLSFFLKTLKPQLKQEWSEEDEYHKRQILRILKDNGCSQTLQEKTEKWIEERIKSLRPQSQWKPSKEQMDMLAKVCSTLHLTSGENEIMESIYDALKKLMEE